MAEERAERVQRFLLSPTLIIGLGGTGHEVVRRVKRELREAYGNIPIIRYLVIDTDAIPTEMEGMERLEDHERVEIRDFDLNEVVGNLGKYPDIERWWPPNGPKEGEIKEGTPMQMRCAGRLALFHKYDDLFISKLEDAINAIFQIGNIEETEKMSPPGREYAVERGKAKIFFIFSVCGGTGSGIFLDVAYLCRELIKNKRAIPKVNAMIVLPTVLETESGVDGDIERRIKANTYASLKELDHFVTTHVWECEYPDRRIEVRDVPFDYTYLLDITNERGDSLNSLSDICEMISDAIFLNIGLPTADEIGRRQAICGIPVQRIDGKLRAYSSLAATSLVFPKREILEYCETKMAEALVKEGFLQGSEESMVEIKRKEIQQAVSVFLSDANLGHEAVISKLREGHRVDIAQEAIIRSEDVGTALELLGGQEGTNREQRESLSSAIDKKFESLLEEARRKLNERVMKAVKERGVHFASLFLEELTAEPPRGLLVLKQKVKKQRSKSEDARNKAEERYEKAKSRLETLEGTWWELVLKLLFLWGRRFKGLKKRCVAYMREYNERFLDIKAQGRAEDLYSGLVEEAESLRFTLDQIRQKLMNASRTLSEDAKDKIRAKRGVYELRKWVVNIDYFKKYYEERVRSIHLPTAYRGFAKELPDEIKQLKDKDEEYYAGRLREHASGYFKEEIERVSVLDIIEETVEEKFRELLRFLEPFWRYNRGELGRKPLPYSIELISVEDENDPRIPEDYRGKAVSTGIRHRIDAIKIALGIPAFLIKGMEDYQTQYDVKKEEGYPLHIDRTWELEDIFP